MAALVQVITRLDQHAAGTDRGIVDAHTGLRIDDLDADPHHFCRGIELARLLAGGIGEEFDKPLIGSAEQVRELEVLVTQGDLFEVLDEIGQGIVIQRALTDLLVEVDALEDVLQRVDIVVFDGLQCLVQADADVLFQVFDLGPVRLCRNKEILA